MDRRTFLAAVPLVFGLDRLSAQDPGRPAWAAEALDRMKATGRFGLLVVVPGADPDQRRAGAALWDLARCPLAAVRGLLAECVVSATARPAALGVAADDRRSLLLLSPEGRVLDGVAAGLAVLEDAERFAKAVDALLKDRRAERAEAVERTLPPGLRGQLDRLDAEEAKDRALAWSVVSSEADRIAPLLAHRARTAATPEARGRASDLLLKVWERAEEKRFGPRLPYGARVPVMASRGCGGLVELPEGRAEDPEPVTIKCGRAAVSAEEARLFLRFLST
jgi:hypothetical protein